MTMQGTGPRRPKPYWRSRVSPGTSATMASRVPVSTLKSVDLPTFGRPTRATTGNMAGPARSGRTRRYLLSAGGGAGVSGTVFLPRAGAASGLTR